MESWDDVEVGGGSWEGGGAERYGRTGGAERYGRTGAPVVFAVFAAAVFAAAVFATVAAVARRLCHRLSRCCLCRRHLRHRLSRCCLCR